MKPIFNLIIALGALIFTACSNGADDLPATELRANLEHGMQVVKAEQNIKKIYLSFETDSSWELRMVSYNSEEASSWATPSLTQGVAGKYNIEVTLAPNEQDDNRAIKIDILPVNENTRTNDDYLLDSLHASLFSVSLIQVGYYSLKYPTVGVVLSETRSLETAITEYITANNLSVGDVKALRVQVELTDQDYAYIRTTLTHLKRLDLSQSGITRIPRYALEGCTWLHYIELPFALTTIEKYAFYRSGLREVNMMMPPYLRNIGECAFADTHLSGMLYFYGLSDTININGGAFANTHIMSVIFGEGISTINENLAAVVDSFYRTSLSYVYLPSTLRNMNNYLFSDAIVARVDCYAQNPPNTWGIIEDDGIGMFLIPIMSYDVYSRNDNYQHLGYSGKLMELLLW